MTGAPARTTCKTESVCFLPGCGGGTDVDEPESEMVSGSAGAGITQAAAVFLLIISLGSRRWLRWLLETEAGSSTCRGGCECERWLPWCGVVWGVVCHAWHLCTRRVRMTDTGDGAGCRPRGACFRRSKRWALLSPRVQAPNLHVKGAWPRLCPTARISSPMV